MAIATEPEKLFELPEASADWEARFVAPSGSFGGRLAYGSPSSSMAVSTWTVPHRYVMLPDSPRENREPAGLYFYPTTAEALDGLYLLISEIARPAEIPAPVFYSPARELSELRTDFGLNLSDTAAVLQATRPTVYSWIEGGPVRRFVQRQRITALHELGRYWRELSPLPVGEALRLRDPSTGKTLLGLLNAEQLDAAAVQRHLDALHRELDKTWAESDSILARHRKAGAWPEPPPQQRLRTRRRT
jgi:hypothetical protein